MHYFVNANDNICSRCLKNYGASSNTYVIFTFKLDTIILTVDVLVYTKKSNIITAKYESWKHSNDYDYDDGREKEEEEEGTEN